MPFKILFLSPVDSLGCSVVFIYFLPLEGATLKWGKSKQKMPLKMRVAAEFKDIPLAAKIDNLPEIKFADP